MSAVGELFRDSPARGVLTRGRLSHWQELLEEWCLIHERYCRLVRGDAIYWSIERSNLAALAAAAWRSGWAALEEFPQPKILKRTRFGGRADLFIKSPSCQDYVESKMCWVTTRRDLEAAALGTSREVRRACRDASALRLPSSDGTTHRIGVVFAVPYFRAAAAKSLPKFLAPFFEALGTTDFDAISWCFPPPARNLVWKEESDDIYPGIVLVAKAV
jgi:hypothetical protein